MDHWRNWKPLAELTAAELRVLALNYRVMAATARMVGAPEILPRMRRDMRRWRTGGAFVTLRRGDRAPLRTTPAR
jgi:hypothetical protein